MSSISLACASGAVGRQERSGGNGRWRGAKLTLMQPAALALLTFKLTSSLLLRLPLHMRPETKRRKQRPRSRVVKGSRPLLHFHARLGKLQPPHRQSGGTNNEPPSPYTMSKKKRQRCMLSWHCGMAQTAAILHMVAKRIRPRGTPALRVENDAARY